MKRVFIDPDGTIGKFFGVIVQYPTGVLYSSQVEGLSTSIKETEGYYVPLGGCRFVPEEGRIGYLELQNLFHEGQGPNRGCRWGKLSPEQIEELRIVVESIASWHEGERDEETIRSHLRLDDSRLDQMVEAWVPVLTVDGPGIPCLAELRLTRNQKLETRNEAFRWMTARPLPN